MSQIKRFISEFCRWAHERGYPKNKRARISAALTKAIEQKLPQLDGRVELIIRPLSNSSNLSLSYETPDVWLYPSKNDQLVSGVVIPLWATGWRHISRDYDVETLIAGFFHFASQHIARGRTAGLMGAIALSYDRSCDFRDSGLQKIAVGPKSYFTSVEVARAMSSQFDEYVPAIKQPLNSQRKCREFAAWVSVINGVDPYIQRAIYQYWKATALFEANFWEEGITALDGVTSVAAQFAKERLGAAANPRQSLAALLDLSPKDVRQITRLYELRCDFGAHPSQSKWWDFAEIYNEDLDSFPRAVKRLLWKLCKAEEKNRIVEPFPKLWSEWFSLNALMILNTVWFLHIR